MIGRIFSSFGSERIGDESRFSMFGAFNRFTDSIRTMVANHVELVSLEFKEEKTRLLSLVIFGVGAVLLGILALVAITASVALYFRDNAFAVLVGFSGFYVVAAIGFVFMLRHRLKEPLFPETRAQLKRDKKQLLRR